VRPDPARSIATALADCRPDRTSAQWRAIPRRHVRAVCGRDREHDRCECADDDRHCAWREVIAVEVELDDLLGDVA
jgi:hypothetical protein